MPDDRRSMMHTQADRVIEHLHATGTSHAGVLAKADAITSRRIRHVAVLCAAIMAVTVGAGMTGQWWLLWLHGVLLPVTGWQLFVVAVFSEVERRTRRAQREATPDA